ncbi:acyl carrier protein [Siccirubricoccus sp. G192]|uniref:acyl carrier protein n=1 Tax=Siccirubricoccus sp. G192 TaxID=2849651 RepID=UPI001C2C1ED6|nr:acyl carrier protein [Siccirubricoccus sp. G192]MBV1797766.1 acyl carrier protein [Siccirubricoccus sp. G192]
MTTEPEIYARLNEVFREVFDDPALEVGPGTTAADIPDWDSQSHIALIVATEMRFGIRFRTAELESLKNVSDFVALIQAKAAG